MLFKEFKYQDKQSKKQMLFNHGVYLAQRPHTGFTILLFQIDSFYVEVYFDTEEEQIGYIRTFTSVDDLEPYLQQVDISGLLAAC
ncbi:MAG: hypothetical protein ACTHOF_12355 [Flavisolibacter sp.]|jgi:hypothetical protein